MFGMEKSDSRTLSLDVFNEPRRRAVMLRVDGFMAKDVAEQSESFAHRNESVKACRPFGRAIRKRWSGYHRRSLLKTKMSYIKRMGEKAMPQNV